MAHEWRFVVIKECGYLTGSQWEITFNVHLHLLREVQFSTLRNFNVNNNL